jgi:hypothetical protein
MTTKRLLLALVLSSWLAVPTLAQPFAPLPPAAEAAPPGIDATPEAAPTPEGAPAVAPEEQPAPADGASAPPVAPEALPAPLPEPLPEPAVQPAPLPPPAAVTPPRPEEENRVPEEPKQKCVIDELCLGPVLTLGLINVLGVGAHARYGQYFGFGIDYQWVPTFSVGDASAGWSLITGEARWYPFGGAFWLGGGIAYQTFTASVTGHMNNMDVILKGTMGMPAFKLGLGFMGHDGFVMGIDIDANIPLGGTRVHFDPLSGPGAPFANLITQGKLQKDINDAANKGVKLIPIIPQINLLRIGYLF